MAVQEIDSFIKKFKDLWKCGFDAHLDVDTHAGQAWVGLRVGLGYHGQQEAGTINSPCRQDARRVEARRVKAEEEDASEADITEDDLFTEENIETKHQDAEEAEEAITEIDENVKTGGEDKGNENTIVVHATAVIDDSSEQNLSQSEINNLEKLIFRNNHLKANILKFEKGQHFTREMRKNRFKHIIELRLHVATKNLWEGARSYVWRHFGQNEWSKITGSSVVFNRIHTKD